jgi:hypothetical protein
MNIILANLHGCHRIAHENIAQANKFHQSFTISNIGIKRIINNIIFTSHKRSRMEATMGIIGELNTIYVKNG